MSDLLLHWLEIEQHLLHVQRPIEAAFAAVNLGHQLVAYRQAALWNSRQGIIALSGAAVVETGSPYTLWLNRLFRHHIGLSQPQMLDAGTIPADLAEQWADWLPSHVILLPMGGEILLFARDDPFTPEEGGLLQRLADLVSLCRRALAPKTLSWPDMTRWRVGALAAVGLGVLLFPVTGSVLAPAESVAAHPVLVRAPLDGVIDHFAIKPNDGVKAGQVLFNLDPTTLRGKLDVACQQYATAEAEYRQAAQAMVFDAKAKAQVAILAGKAEEKAAEAKLLESQLDRITVKAPQDGVALFDDVADWIGKPVAVGEKVLSVADDADSEVEAWVSAADVGEIRSGGGLTLFLNTAPLSPVKAHVRLIAYEATARPDNTIAHRLRASLDDPVDRPRLGLKGTARIDGDSVPLVWWLFRKPLAAIRQFVGL